MAQPYWPRPHFSLPVMVAGESAYRVGVADRSGVGGGNVAIVRRRGSIAVWDPVRESLSNAGRDRRQARRRPLAA